MMVRRRTTLILSALVVGIGATATANAAPEDVILNELTTWAPQRVEVVNTEAAPVDISGFQLRGSDGILLTVPAATVIAGNGILTFAIPGDTLPLTGDALAWIDDLTAPIDSVAYGVKGGAPVPIAAAPFSLARTGGSAFASSAQHWTMAFISTLGAPNLAPPAELNTGGVVMNEWLFFETSAAIEIYNPTATAVFLGGYRVTNDLDELILPSALIIPPLGFVQVDIFALRPNGAHSNLYLFRPDFVRIDQIGLADAPGDSTTIVQLRADANTLCALPNGAGPRDGFDLPTSGWNVTRFACVPTLGLSNTSTTSVDDALTPTTWGAIKTRY